MRRNTWIAIGALGVTALGLGGCSCDLDISCTPPAARCGDGKLQAGEECEDQSMGCSWGSPLSDTLPDHCRTNCRWYHCGDGVVDSNEECDGAGSAGATCGDLGFDGGQVGCTADCHFDTSGCLRYACGNDRLDPGEVCDGQHLGGWDCAALGFPAGRLRCGADCALDLTSCEGCGNGVAEPYEPCDGTDLKRATCEMAGFTGGDLACGPDCLLDLARCYRCPDGRCDAAAGEAAAGCAADCAWLVVDVGPTTACGVRTDGWAHCWGLAGSGALGNGDPGGPEACPAGPCSPRPLPVALPAKVMGVSVGAGHACARLGTGEAWCWGAAGSGQLGDGDVHAESCDGVGECSSTPVPVRDATGVVALDLGEAHGCARRSDGSVICWGLNDDGQLGSGTRDATRVPVPVVGLSGVTALAVGAGHGCAVLADATVACWGQNDRGQLGAGDPSGPESCASGPCSPAPVPVLGLFDASELAAGWAHTCALRLDGTVWCWGDNAQGQLGDGTTEPHALPVEVAGLPPIVALSLRSDTTCALDLEGAAWCWGLPSATPQPWPFPGPYAALALGETVTCALDPAAALWCWGEGAAGLLGSGGTGDATAPTRVD